MIRTAAAIGVAAVAYMAVSGNAPAMPMAPTPAEITTQAPDIIPVYYYGRRYYPYRWRSHYYRHRYYRYGRWRYY